MEGERIGLYLKRIDALRGDNLHGATWLTRTAAEILREAADAGLTPREWTKLAVEVAKTRPMMASVFRLADECLKSMDKGKDPQIFVETFLKESKRKAEAVVRLAARKVPDGGLFLVHSHSSLVAEALLRAHAAGKRFRVFCTESRPQEEGVGLARRLCEAGVDTTLIVDGAAGEVLPNCNAFWLGCDGLGSFGLVHKIGTFPMVAAARSVGVGITVLCTGNKFWPRVFSRPEEPSKDPDDLGHRGCFEVWNRYFDVTPLELLTTCVTEEGETKVEEALERYGSDEPHPTLAEAFQRSMS